MRWLIGAAVAVFMVAALGTAAELASRRADSADPAPGVIQHVDGSGRVVGTSRFVAPAPTVTPAVSYRRITTHGVATTARLMVNEGAYLIVQRALDERDDKTLFWAWNTYEYLDVPPGTRVEVLKVDGRAYHLEVLEGKHAGRRGWVSDAYVDQ